MAPKLYADYDWLKTMYVVKRKNAKDIAEMAGVTEMTVWNYLKKYDLLKYRGKGRNLGKRVVKRDW